jgi:hypothetical protein
MLLTLTLGVFLSLASDVSSSCKAAISDPPRSPRHTLTPQQRDLVLQRLNAEYPLNANGPRDEPWKYEFTDVVLHKGTATVTLTVRDVDAGEHYPGQTCVRSGVGSVRGMIYDRHDECRLQKYFFATIHECLEQLESGRAGLAGKPVPIPD